MNERIHGAFDAVHAEETLKTATRNRLAGRVAKANRPVTGGKLAAAFACLAVVLLGLGGWRLYMTPVSAISVDVNPSVELGVNRFDRVVSVEGYNEDGERLAASVNLKNMEYSDALETLLTSGEMKPYIDNNGLISITVIGNTEQKSQEMRSRIAACDYASSPNVDCLCGDREEISAAHELGLSFGKYQALTELLALDPDASLDDVRDWTMRQIRDRIEELSGMPIGNQHGNGAGGHGNGYGGG